MNIFIDIETIPSQRPDLAAHVKIDSRLKDPAKIEAATEQAIERAGLAAETGEIWCIGYACDDQPVEICHRGWCDVRPRGPENDLLHRFFASMEELPAVPTIIGHNVEFDIGFIWRRAVVNGVAVPRWWPRPLDIKPWVMIYFIFCTMKNWAGARGTISLDRLCWALGIPGKDGDITGATVYQALQDGREQEVIDYCKGDVERARECWRRMTGQ